MEAMTSEREAFEKWIDSAFPHIAAQVAKGLAPAARDAKEMAWAGWQAAHLAQPAQAVDVGAPSIEAAEAMGAKGGPAVEAERLAFEAWMRGHCWALCATWNGSSYRSDAEQGGNVCPHATKTRGLWAAWRDRAALTRALSAEKAGWRPGKYSREQVDACAKRMKFYGHDIATAILTEYANALPASPTPGKEGA